MGVNKHVKKIKKKKQDIFNHGAKVLCICLLVGQMVGLNYLIIEQGKQADIWNRYKWVVMDVFVFSIWLVVLIWSYMFDRGYADEDQEKNDEVLVDELDVRKVELKESKINIIKEIEEIPTKEEPHNDRQENMTESQKKNVNTEGKERDNVSGRLALSRKLLKKPLILIPIIWLLYTFVLVAKIEHMFSTFALSLPQGDHLISSTFLKISLAKTAFILTLLIYAVKSHVKDPDRETLITDKMANAATLDVIDSVMLLDMMFDIQNPSAGATPIYLCIRGFACICLILPVVPLISILFLAESESTKLYHLNLIVNTASRMFLGNIPHLVLRLILWHSQEVDVSTFLIKNLIVLFVGIVDIVKHSRHYRKDINGKRLMEDTEGTTDNTELQTVINT